MATTLNLIEAKTLGSSVTSVTFSSIPQTYTDLKLLICPRSDTNSSGANIFFNTKVGGEYAEKRTYGTGSSVGADTGNTGGSITNGGVGNGTYTGSVFGNGEIYIPNYTSTSLYKACTSDGASENNAVATLMFMVSGLRSMTAAITSIIIDSYSGNFVTNSTFYLYGISNS
jgi:hypothetical protein